jgi:hypothetical protein
MAWWIWATTGLLLLGLEAVTNSGFYIFFFAVSALLVALLSVLGIVEDTDTQYFLFSAMALVTLAFVRVKLVQMVSPRDPRTDRDGVEGKFATAKEPLLPGGEGEAELRGSTWRARNVGRGIIATGDSCRVVRSSGIILEVTTTPPEEG